MMVMNQINEALVSNIYNFKPAFNNLFEVTFTGTNTEKLNSEDEFNNATRFACSAVNFGGESIELNRHDITKLFYLDNFKRQDSLKLTFTETNGRVVRQFHQDWLAKFYDKDNDTFCSYDTLEEAEAALYRNIIVKFPYTDDKIWVVNFNRVMIKSIPELDLAWGKPKKESYTVEYAVTSWDFKSESGTFNPETPTMQSY